MSPFLFDWDPEDGNSDHVREHGVEPDEAEQAFADPGRLGAPAYNVGGERRVGSVGATDAGRVLYLIAVWRQERVRIITARDASAAMKRRYRQRGK